MQIDNPSRGFSFKVDGPLDLRLNQQQGISAAERLDTISREELAGMLYENSDEPYCEELAKAITDEIRKGHRIDTTTKLREVIEKTLDFLPEKEIKDTIKKTCQRTCQAVRIDVNRERHLCRLCERRDPPFCGGMCTERQSPFHEDALGGPGGRTDRLTDGTKEV